MLKRALVAAAIACAAAGAHADVLLSEGFGDVPGLAGWVITNVSTPTVGPTSWFQGDVGIFTAQSGSAESYAAVNYNSGVADGTLSDWLITPTFSTASAGTVSFYARSAGSDGLGLVDFLAAGFSSGASSSIGGFTLSSAFAVSTAWTQYTFSFGAQGAGSVGRFAIVYTGSDNLANYVGVDSLVVDSAVAAVPEPSTYLMFGAGLLGLAWRSRRAVSKR